MNQQQYQQNVASSGRVLFLATNMINMLIFALAFYQCVFDERTNWPIYVDIALLYLSLHNLFGIICALDNSITLLTNYKISSYIVGVIDITTLIVAIIGATIFAKQSSVGDALIFLFCCFAMILGGVESIICYTNIKYINQLLPLIKLSSQPYHLPYFADNISQSLVNTTLSQPIHAFSPHANNINNIAQQYPQLYYPQQKLQQNFMLNEQRQQVSQPIVSDIPTGQMYAQKQPLVFQNGYTQYQ